MCSLPVISHQSNYNNNNNKCLSMLTKESHLAMKSLNPLILGSPLHQKYRAPLSTNKQTPLVLTKTNKFSTKKKSNNSPTTRLAAAAPSTEKQ